MLRALILSAPVLILLAVPRADAGATIAFGSSVGAVNLTSSGGALDARFAFEIGCFTPGFTPTRSNTGEWIMHWQPFPQGTAKYRTDVLGSPFPADPRLNSFAGSVMLGSNPVPFTSGNPVYLWGFDRRTSAGKGEWILMTAPSWTCPDGASMNPAVSYAVADATTPILGAVNEDGVEMRTAAVALSGTQENLTQWKSRNFLSATADATLETGVYGSMADPDHDNVPNLMEFFLGTDPAWNEGTREFTGPFHDAGSLVLRYRRSVLTSGVTGGMEWSPDLRSWSRFGLAESVIDGDAASLLIEARLPAPAQGPAFFRLRADQ